MKADKIIRSFRSSIGIRISTSGELIVSAPVGMPDFFIERFLDSKKDWIHKHQGTAVSHKKPYRGYTEGEEFLFLGRIYKLHFGNFKEVSLTTTLNVPTAVQFRVKKELTSWYLSQARGKILQRLEVRSKEMQTHFGDVRFSDTSSKWGTCFHDNSLQFNWRLIMAPLMVLDYVVIHELAHTIEKNHGSQFWKIVARFTPAHKQHRKWLNEHANLLTV